MIPAMNLDPSFPSRYFCGTLAKFVTRHFSLPLLLLMMMFGNLDVAVRHAQAPPQDASASDWTRVPRADWARVKPDAAGYSSARLEALRAWLKTQQTTAMLVAVHGTVIFEYGDLSRVSKVASVRKSVLAMLYGNYVVSGKIDTDKTVKSLAWTIPSPSCPLRNTRHWNSCSFLDPVSTCQMAATGRTKRHRSEAPSIRVRTSSITTGISTLQEQLSRSSPARTFTTL
jgi:hypothetical protein